MVCRLVSLVETNRLLRLIRELDLRVQDKMAKMQTMQNEKEKKKLKDECIALTHEKIKIAQQLEEQLKNAIGYVNTKIKKVQTKIQEKNKFNGKDKNDGNKAPLKK